MCTISRPWRDVDFTINLMHGSILHVTIPPGQPRGQVQPFGPGGGELFETVLSRGRGAGQIENNSLLFLVLVRYVTSRLTPNRVKKTAYFQEESLEFVADWLEKNNLSKLKSVFEGTFIIIC